jgi:hypothetical protein
MSIIDSIESFAQGMDPTAVRLILGTFEFIDFEVPTSIAVSGEQQTVVHKLVGGKKTVDVLGVDYNRLTWSGIITGSNCSDRVSALEAMRDTGQPVTLTFDNYSFNVLIARFAPVYELPYKRPYSIEVEVISRNDAPLRVDALTGSLDALVNSDVGSALGLSSTAGISSVTSAVTTVQSAVKQVSDFAHATVSDIQTVVRPIVAAQALVSQQISSLEASANSITSLGGLVPGNPIAKTINNLLTQTQLSTQTSALYDMQNVLGRLNKNVQTGQTADGVSTVTQTGGNLYQVAAQQYGDATLWSSIANANGLTDPQLTGINTLTIPSNPTQPTSSRLSL